MTRSVKGREVWKSGVAFDFGKTDELSGKTEMRINAAACLAGALLNGDEDDASTRAPTGLAANAE